MEYTVKTSDLYQRAKEMLNDGMTYVTISLNPPDGDLPACVSFSAWQEAYPEEQTDYDDLDVIPQESE